MDNSTLHLTFNRLHATKLFQIVVAVEICLIALYLIDHVFMTFGHPHQMLDLDGEMSIPSWFSSIQLFFIGIILLVQLFKTPRLLHMPLWFITIVAFSFMFLSLDESISFHEKLNFRYVTIDWLPRFKNNNGLWIPIYLSMIVTFVFFARRQIADLWQFYRKEIFIFALGIILFLLGGVVLEIISYEYLQVVELKKWYLLEVAMEEGLEMIGASLMLYASLLLALH